MKHLVCFLSLIAACFSWETYGGDNQFSRVSKFDIGSTPTFKWMVDLSDKFDGVQSGVYFIVTKDGVAFVNEQRAKSGSKSSNDSTTNLVAIDMINGNQLWKRNGTNSHVVPTVMHNGLLVSMPESKSASWFDYSNGKPLTTFPGMMSVEILEGSAQWMRMRMFSATGPYFFSLDQYGPIWRAAAPKGKLLVSRVITDSTGSLAYFVTSSSSKTSYEAFLNCISVAQRSVAWSVSLGISQSPEGELILYESENGNLIIHTGLGSTKAFRTSDGKLAWTFNKLTTLPQAMALDKKNNRLFLAVKSDDTHEVGITQLNVLNGIQKWKRMYKSSKFHRSINLWPTSPTITKSLESVVYGYGNFLYAVNSQSGQDVWHAFLPDYDLGYLRGKMVSPTVSFAPYPVIGDAHRIYSIAHRLEETDKGFTSRAAMVNLEPGQLEIKCCVYRSLEDEKPAIVCEPDRTVCPNVGGFHYSSSYKAKSCTQCFQPRL